MVGMMMVMAMMMATCWLTGRIFWWRLWTGTTPSSAPSASARYREAAEGAARALLERFGDGARGGFCDIADTPDRPGYLRVRGEAAGRKCCRRRRDDASAPPHL